MTDDAKNEESEQTETEQDAVKVSLSPTGSRRLNPLSRPGDEVARPGFRSTSNKRTKAQRKRKKRR